MNQEKTETYSCRLLPQTKKDLSELSSSGDFATQDQMFNTLIERYNNPMQINKNNQEKADKLEKELISVKEHYDEQLKEEKEKYLRLANVHEELKKKTEQLEHEWDNLIPMATIPEGGTVLFLDPLNVQILNYVATREGKKRKQEWTISDVVNYFVYSRFEKGELNGNLSSVPDEIIKQMRKELE
jgi:hypothetical protein